MTRVLMLMAWGAMLWFGAGCQLIDPVPDGRQVDVHKAVVKVLALYGDPEPKWLPKVFIVEPVAGLPKGVACFMNRDDCVSGVMFPGVSIYMVKLPWQKKINTFTLAHELLHWVGWSHPVDQEWPVDSLEGRLLGRGQALLDSLPEDETSQEN